ncbi:glutaredoxin family protein [Psychromonas antarctica]|jgi:hypothetical protein|uniref:glutaredoxin family protein n=1 Tax=Psychromonas antarctica TaxID=67573 RepID=UPI001EE87C9B|nr:glutaredoxin family protein [Psychromonas antarctica]MCG6201872.1 glutaredoxin family protein [Psychromonas antarctica]
MTSNKNLVLYFTDGCHLCDDAVKLLQQTTAPYSKIDIVHDQQLVDLYGYLIPVIEDGHGNTISWPFNTEQLNDFIHT